MGEGGDLNLFGRVRGGVRDLLTPGEPYYYIALSGPFSNSLPANNVQPPGKCNI